MVGTALQQEWGKWSHSTSRQDYKNTQDEGPGSKSSRACPHDSLSLSSLYLPEVPHLSKHHLHAGLTLFCPSKPSIVSQNLDIKLLNSLAPSLHPPKKSPTVFWFWVEIMHSHHLSVVLCRCLGQPTATERADLSLLVIRRSLRDSRCLRIHNGLKKKDTNVLVRCISLNLFQPAVWLSF